MPKLIIKYPEQEAETKEPEPEFELFLREEDGTVYLSSPDAEYPLSPWNILKITPKGKLVIIAGLPKDFGLKLGEDGRVLVENE